MSLWIIYSLKINEWYSNPSELHRGRFDSNGVWVVFAPPREYTITSDEPNHPPCAAVLNQGHQELTDPL